VYKKERRFSYSREKKNKTEKDRPPRRRRVEKINYEKEGKTNNNGGGEQ